MTRSDPTPPSRRDARRHLQPDPDPLYVKPEPVHRAAVRDAQQLRSGMVIVWLAAILVVIAVVCAVMPAPRGASSSTIPWGVAVTSSALPGAPADSAGGSTTAPAGAPRRVSGTATWYCLSGSSACTRGYGQSDLVGAIDSDLGFRKGDRVVVRYGARSVTVEIVDVCGCPGERLIDLTSGAFARLADLGLGVIPVTLELAEPGVTLPPTDEEVGE